MRTSRTSPRSSGHITTSKSAVPANHAATIRCDAPRWMAADTNTFASRMTRTPEVTDQLVARRRRTARTSSTASSSASSSSRVLFASTLEANASRVVAVKLSHADCRVTPRASPICCHDAPADRAAMTCSRRIRSSSCSLSVRTRSAANGSCGRASGTTITLMHVRIT